jgi:predicted lipid-binding transport protein (Tim44 family)
MSTLLDPLNIILLVAAGYIVWRLFGVLGHKTDHSRPTFDPFSSAPASTREDQPVRQDLPKSEPEAPSLPIWHGIAPEGSALANNLEQIAKADPAFSVAAFLEGAKIAYEMVLEAYAKADKAALKPLLSKEMLEDFAKEIDRRRDTGETAFLQFVGVKQAKVDNAYMSSRRARITVQLDSQMISATRNAQGETLEGDTKEIRDVSDRWTFERDTASRDPNWRLIETGDGAA